MKDVSLLTSNGVDIKKSLELFGDMEMYNATLSDFLKAVDEKLSKIKQYKESADMANYAIFVHSLKSDARYLGFTKLAELAYEHELKSKENNVNFVYDNYDILLDETNRIIDLVNNYMGNDAKPRSVNKKDASIKDETIIIIDDSNLVSNFIAKIFDDRFEVLIASDGEEAIKIIEENKNKNIVAALLDLNMPKVNGFQVLDYFKQNNLFVKIPVSIITGNDFKELVDRAFTYPIVDMLSKPFNERDIKRVVEKTINFNKQIA